VTDALGRIGGDEFAMILPGCSGAKALAVIDRARAAIAATPLAGGLSLTVSAGIADLADAADADRLLRLASGALRWSKAQGGDATRIYDARAIPDRSREWARRLERSHTLAGIRRQDRRPRRRSAEARPARRSRVRADQATRAARGRDRQRGALTRAGRLDSRASRAAGRPRLPRRTDRSTDLGRSGILAVADAIDVMTMTRPYSRAKPLDEALAECRALVGRQFMAEPVDALVAMLTRTPSVPRPLR
jgi:Diguanylate cyclase, GGDEF domain